MHLYNALVCQLVTSVMSDPMDDGDCFETLVEIL